MGDRIKTRPCQSSSVYSSMAKWNLKYYFRAVFAPASDFLPSQFDERFAGHHKIATSLCALVPHYFGKTTFEDLKPILLLYE